MDGHVSVEATVKMIDEHLEHVLPLASQVPQVLHEAMRYSALAPGKRLRPQLVLASCVAVGGHREQVLDAACAVEIVHCFSLIHDDLPSIDDDDLRRGRPTCHKVYGEAVAILAGDALFALAFELMASLPSKFAAKAASLLAKASGTSGLVGGEVMDILSEGKECDLTLLTEIHRRKTGGLIAASCEIGAVLGGGTSEQIASLRRFGEEIGLAFQIADDVLNETSTPEELGKAVGSDRARGKLTYPRVLGLAGAQLAAQSASERALASLDAFRGETSGLFELAGFTVDRRS